MDTLSQLIRLAQLRGSVDVRCLVAGRHTLDNPAANAGQAPFHLLLSGVCELELGGRRIEVVAGDMVLLPRGIAHRMHVPGRRTAEGVKRNKAGSFELIANTTYGGAARTQDAGQEEADTPVDLFCGHYSWAPGPGQVLMDLLPEIVHVPLGGTKEGIPGPLGQLCDVMRSEARTATPGTDAILDGMCDVLLAMALRHTQGLERAVWLASAEGAVRTVTEAVLNDPSRDWSIKKFATLSSMSRATLIRRFTRETGMNPGDFLIRMRMLVASDLLTATDRSISAIAAAVGYGSESAFGRAFRLATGSTPAQLRRSAQEHARRGHMERSPAVPRQPC